MPRIRPEQLEWGLKQDLAITASGNYFVLEANNGNVYLDFAENSGSTFSIKKNSTDIFSIKDNGEISISGSLTIGEDVYVAGALFLSGSIISGSSPTASHLQEEGVAVFNAVDPTYYISGGFFRSSSGDWFVS